MPFPAPLLPPVLVVETIPVVQPGPRLPDASRTPPPLPGKPCLRNVVSEDLKDSGRLLELYDQAIVRGWVTASERDRLRFVGAAEHARVIGTRNPCGLFVRLVRCGLWSFLTQDDEDVANVRLKRHLYGAASERRVPKSPPPRAVEGSLKTLLWFVRFARWCPGRGIEGMRIRC